MKIYQDSFLNSLEIPDSPGVTALVGGGGKTSLMLRLAAEAAAAGKTAVVTTTTRILAPERPDITLLNERDDFSSVAETRHIFCIGKLEDDGKLHFPGTAAFNSACRYADRVFVEADGAKFLPAKAPSEREPVIPEQTDSLIAVAGLDALGKSIAETCFRSELVCRILHASPDHILTPEMFARLLTSTQGQRKNLPSGATFNVLLNKADDEARLTLGKETAEHIRKLLPDCRVVISALQQEDSIKAIYI